jgi:hypothetical protein
MLVNLNAFARTLPSPVVAVLWVCLTSLGCQPAKDTKAFDEAIKEVKNENRNVAFCEKIAAVHRIAQKKQDDIPGLTWEPVKKRQLASEELADALKQIEKDSDGIDPQLITALKRYTLAHDAFVRNVKNCDDFDLKVLTGGAKVGYAYIGGGFSDAVGELKELPSPKTGAAAYKQANLAIIEMKIQANHFNDVAAEIEKREGIAVEKIAIVFRKGHSEGLLLKPEMVNGWSPEKLEEIKKENQE